MNVDSQSTASAAVQQAAEWYWQIREPDVTPDVISVWQAWLQASTENREAFSNIEAVLQQVDRVEDPPWPTEEEVLNDTYDARLPVAKWRASQERPRNRATEISRLRSWAIAASVVVLLAVALTMTRLDLSSGPDTALQPDFVIHETRAAEHRDVPLPDGSSVMLGGKSLISVAYTKQSRLVVLEQGAAFFEVAKDPGRPFLVQAGSRRITAVGTAFNVTRQDDRVVVTVTEGTVLVTPETPNDVVLQNNVNLSGSNETGMARLEAGHQITYDTTTAKPVTIANPADAIAWREGRLKYRGESLRYVVVDVNRYADRPITLADDTAGDILFTGTVFRESVDTWLSGLEQVFPVSVEETPQGVVIRHDSPEAR